MRLVGISAALPRESVPITAAYERFGKEAVDRAAGNIGVLRHREVQKGQTAADLGIAAAKDLLARTGWDASTIDLLVMTTQTPDHTIPGSSHRIHAALGMRLSSMCFDVALGCSGFTHGMLIVRGLMASGLAKRAVIVSSEIGTDRFRRRITEAELESELPNALLFGDAASAVAFDAEGPDQWRGDVVGADGNGYQHIHLPAGGYREWWTPEMTEARPDAKGDLRRPTDLVLNGAEVFSFTIRRVPPMTDEVLKRAGWSTSSVDRVVFHQANKFMMEFLRKKIGVPVEKAPYSIEEFGNTSSASIPLTILTRAQDRWEVPTKWVFLGFGVGLSWSAVAIETDRIIAGPPVEV